MPHIRIVGGGPSGLSAAFRLASDPDIARSHQITVYQPGWRLGGKGATGRPIDGPQVVEEHGIHGFTGFYFGTFSLLRESYPIFGDWYRNQAGAGAAPDTPPLSIDEAFIGSDASYRIDRFDAGPRHAGWAALPHRRADSCPWDDAADRFFTPNLSRLLLEYLADAVGRLVGVGDDRDGPSLGGDEWLEVQLELAAIAAKLPDAEPWAGADRAIFGRVADALVLAVNAAITRIERLTRRELGGPRRGAAAIAGGLLDLDFGLALAKGCIAAGLLRGDLNLSPLDRESHIEWLRRHGCDEATLNSSIPKSFTNVLFGWADGDSVGPGAHQHLSAATFVGWVLRSLYARGDYFFLFAAGTGDTVIAPIYVALREKGVRFEFFHRLTDVRVGEDGGAAQLEFERQADLAGDAYDPLVRIEHRNQYVWPNAPLADQLAEVHDDPPNMENAARGHGPLVTVDVGADDHVILAMPPPAVLAAAPSLLAERVDLRDQLAAIDTTSTIAAQLWFDDADGAVRGCFAEEGGAPDWGRRFASTSFEAPLNGVVDFTDLIEWEGWEGDGKEPPGALIYLCGQIGDGVTMTENDVVGAALGALTEHWPNVDFGGRVRRSFVRVNTDPAAQYATAVPGTWATRAGPDMSGVERLLFAGDWLDTGLNAGCFESAVVGGALAAAQITGHLDAAAGASRSFGRQVIADPG